MTDAAESARIRSLRPSRPAVDPWRPLGVELEEERGADGELFSSVTVFLAGSECPFTCVFCDLWQHTLDEPTPVGAIPRQLQLALESIEPTASPVAIKLYNASNFFETRAVPEADLPAIAALLAPFRRVTVECHPRLIGEDCEEFAERLDGHLEVALGLETIHPVALASLNKQLTLEEFDRAVSLLQGAGIGVRTFVLVSPPFVPAAEAVDWAVRSVEYALDRGVEVVSLIPTRTGYGEMERLAAEGLFTPPTLEVFAEAVGRSLQLNGGVVLADLWDIDKLPGCTVCRDARIERLGEMNRSGAVGGAIVCDRCAQERGVAP